MSDAQSSSDGNTLVICATLKTFSDWLDDYLWSTDQQQPGIPIQQESYPPSVILSYINPFNGFTRFIVRHRGSGELTVDIENLTGKHNIPDRIYVSDTSPESQTYLQKLINIVQDRWIGPKCPYDFSKITEDRDLEEILTSQWIESVITYNAGAYLATVVLLGSILEGILMAKVLSNPQLAGNANSAPKNKSSNKILSFNEWSLENLIDVAHDCQWIGVEVKDFSKVVRKYRNLIHPRERQKHLIRITLELCDVTRAAVQSALQSLTNP